MDSMFRATIQLNYDKSEFCFDHRYCAWLFFFSNLRCELIYYRRYWYLLLDVSKRKLIVFFSILHYGIAKK